MADARESPDVISADPHLTDPPLLKDNSEFKSYKTSRFDYPNLRIFFQQHAKARELPAPLPLLVCIPGLGGSVAQFHPLLSSLVDLAPCLAIDYPGGGRSAYTVTSWDAYNPDALLELLETVIEDYRDKDAGQSVVLIGHSMGTALAAHLANRKASHTTQIAEHVVGLVAICPTSGPWNESTSTALRRLLWIPGWMFALWRAWDGMGGLQSPSVARFVGAIAEPELKLLQYRFNQQSRTPVWRRMAYGALPVYKDGKPVGGIPGLDTWADLDIPVYLIAGEKDHLTPPREVGKIVEAMGLVTSAAADDTEQPEVQSTDAAAPVSLSLKPQDHLPDGKDGLKEGDVDAARIDRAEMLDDPHDDLSTPVESDSESPDSPGLLAPLPAQLQHPPKVVQSIVIPAPANHALLYMPRSARCLAGLISDFLATHITGRLSLAWQLHYLSREGKWDVKNLNKWKSVAPVSQLIGPPGEPVFRAMKTLREADEVHCPAAFVEQWGSVVKDVIDISKDQPVYDPRGLERGGVHYHKFPTVSKVPPQAQDVEAFIELVDKLRRGQKERAAAEAWDDAEQFVVGVHCHYGFNRTGYFIVCYLVERCGFSLPDAIEEFARARPGPGTAGIRHSHFLNQLYLRYTINEARG